MNNLSEKYFALRFRSVDELHRKGDVQYGDDNALYIGQTEECGLRIAAHPDYADSCYAVIVKNDDGTGWRIIRQENGADITVNGEPLALVRNLRGGDLLKFDRTVVQFTEEQGDRPNTRYVQSKPAWGVWAAMAGIVAILAGIVAFLYLNNQKPVAIFKREVPSICKIEADTLLIISSQGDTLDVIPTDRALVGTGFVTEDGYFVTARHCVEFWLGMESELRPNLRDIESPFVRWAVEAEMDTTIRLVSKLKITSQDGSRSWYFSSDAFTMDKSHDDIYDCGDFETPYLWRSVVSLYEKQDTELGDVAVIRWPYGKGTVKLGTSDNKLMAQEKLYGFGYPQSENRQEALFTSIEAKVSQDQKSPNDWFLCDPGFDPGFSGGPVFTRSSGRTVAGIVSRSAGNRTLIVPVSQIHNLIGKIE